MDETIRRKDIMKWTGRAWRHLLMVYPEWRWGLLSRWGVPEFRRRQLGLISQGAAPVYHKGRTGTAQPRGASITGCKADEGLSKGDEVQWSDYTLELVSQAVARCELFLGELPQI